MAGKLESEMVRTVSHRLARSFSGQMEGELRLDVGDKCQPLIVMKVRAGQDFASQVVGQVSLGTEMHVTEVGQGHRIKISTSKVSGWISHETELGHPLVKPVAAGIHRAKTTALAKVKGHEVPRPRSFNLSPEQLAAGTRIYVALGELAVGQLGETLVAMNVREDESFKSKVVGRLPQSSVFEVICVGANNRIRVESGNLKGWISAKADGDRPLVRKPRKEAERKNSQVGRITSSEEMTSYASDASTTASSVPEMGEVKETMSGAKKAPVLPRPLRWLSCCSA